MKNHYYDVLQRIGRSFMLPIALLPVAGIFLGIASTFSNETLIATYHLESVLGNGTFLNHLIIILKNVSSAIFENLPLLFAGGVALGMSKKEQGVAVISSIIAFLTMHKTINALLQFNHLLVNHNTIAAETLPGTIVEVCGIYSLEMGIFGGIIVGLGVSYLHNRFYKIKLPKAVSFFGGTRFVPIISTVVYLFVGVLLFYIWPPVQLFIYQLGYLVTNTGYFGTLLFGVIKRLLVPFGLHHVFYMPFWQSAVGGSQIVNGVLVSGGQNIFFAQMMDPHLKHFSVEATRYFSGEFIFMIFGLPGAALAMYQCSYDKNKKKVGSLLFSAALTSILTGITEPIEFTFIFVAPILFGIQIILAGSAYMLAHIFDITVGLTFSGGVIDLLMFGILQGQAKTNWMMIIPLGIIYFFLYYFLFKFFINKYDLKTLGREDEEKDDYPVTLNSIDDKQSQLIVEGLGGSDNFQNVECCVTR
ncbi:MAG: PTS transporter subunit EIIC, partial [Faecalibacillus sp.]